MDARDSRLCVGSGSTADLVLADALVAKEHAEFTLVDGKLLVKSLGGKLFLDGKQLVDQDPVELKNFQFLTVGVTQMVTGPAEGEWPPINVQNAPALEQLADEVPQEVAKTAATAAANPSASRAIREQAAKKAKKRRRLGVFFFTLALFVVGIIALALAPQKKKVTPAELEKILQAQVADMNYFSTVAVHTERGQIIVDGYVPTNRELRELRTALAATHPGIQYNVRSNEKIVETVEEMLRSIDGSLRVIPMQAGVYSIVGYAFNGDSWQKLRPRLLSDVAGVRKIQNDVMTPERVVSLAQATFNERGLRNIAIDPEANRIFIHGTISVLQSEQWKLTVEDLIQTFADIVPLEFDIQTYSAQTETSGGAFFPAAIQSITISSSGLSWIATNAGKKYFIGSFLPSGWRVDSIAVDGLSLSRDGKQITMHLEALQ
jgi:type III secretion system YscD/HrpQ family protein